jgi:hypothetical protein
MTDFLSPGFRAFVAFSLVAILLAGCTGSGEDRLGQNLVAPGGYEFYDCGQLANSQRTLIARNKELERLMDKARQGPAGGFVSAVTYEPEYASNRASLREVEREQAVKNCSAPQSPPAGTN